MSIYISGMEMPKEGSWRSIRIYPDGTIGRPIGFGDYALVEGAKAIPVPEHGEMTNADRIRQMTDEELAIFLSDVTSNAIVILGIGSEKKSKSAFDWYTWLINPVEKEN